jgi:hypothetical protein
MKPYLPSNGTEGMVFEAAWCEKCIRHSLSPEAKTQCVHLCRALAGEDNGKWFYDESGAGTCLSFKSRKDSYKKRQKKTDERQLVLFK